MANPVLTFVIQCLDNSCQNSKALDSAADQAGSFLPGHTTLVRFSHEVAKCGNYLQNPKNSDTQNIAVLTIKFEQGGLTVE